MAASPGEERPPPPIWKISSVIFIEWAIFLDKPAANYFQISKKIFEYKMSL
jgi:hypothetical protein